MVKTRSTQKVKKDKAKKEQAEDSKLIELQEKLIAAEEEKKRVLADYQNLVRRTQEDRVKLIKMSNRDLVMSLLQPLQHLEMAAGQISDAGLDMVVGQFKNNLSEFGLEEIEVMGKEFDVETMEAVEIEGDAEENKNTKVIKVSQKGYKLNGEVIQHAKVVLG